MAKCGGGFEVGLKPPRFFSTLEVYRRRRIETSKDKKYLGGRSLMAKCCVVFEVCIGLVRLCETSKDKKYLGGRPL